MLYLIVSISKALNLIRGLLFADNQFDERLQALTMTDYKYQGSGNFVMKLR